MYTLYPFLNGRALQNAKAARNMQGVKVDHSWVCCGIKLWICVISLVGPRCMVWLALKTYMTPHRPESSAVVTTSVYTQTNGNVRYDTY